MLRTRTRDALGEDRKVEQLEHGALDTVLQRPLRGLESGVRLCCHPRGEDDRLFF